MKSLTFLIYTLAWQSFVWASVGYLMLERDWSAWWIVLAVFMSSAQYKPERWGQIQ